MLLYRGDKYVTGKKFKINESNYIFIKRDKDDNLIFESIKDGSKLKLTESDMEKPYEVRLWDTEEDRDQGFGYTYDTYKTRDEAIKVAKELWEDGDYAAVEAQYNDEDGYSYGICTGADGEFTFYDEDLEK